MHLNGKRKWVTVSDGVLTIYKSWKDMNAGAADKEKREIVDLKICSVKKLEPDPKDKEKDKERFAFTLISPERTLTCDVSEASELDEWLTVLKNGIASSLKKRAANRSASPNPHNPSPSANASGAASSNAPITTVTFAPVPTQDKAAQAALALVRSANSANALCGDCTAKGSFVALHAKLLT